MDKCRSTYVSGYRKGKPCPYRASVIVLLQVGEPFIVCGYHARQFTPDVQYPMWANLTQLRRLQMTNVAAR